VVNIFNGIIAHKTIKSLNKEVIITLKHDEKSEEKEERKLAPERMKESGTIT